MRLLHFMPARRGFAWLLAGMMLPGFGVENARAAPLDAEISVTDPQFGARCDGASGDAGAIQAAIRYGQTNGAAVNFPSRTCVLDTPISGNGGTAHLKFHDTLLVQTHAGWGIALAQSAVNAAVTIDGAATFVPWAVAAGAITVTFPAGTQSFAQSTFEVYGKINCHTAGQRYFVQCLELDNAWNAVVYGLNYIGPIVGNRPVAGTAAVTIGGSGYAGVNQQFYNLNAFSADAAVWLKGYTEGIYLANPQAVDVNWGLRVGNAVVDAAGHYQGEAGIAAKNGIYCNLIQIIGGEFNTFRSGIMADRCQQVISRGSHFYNAHFDGANPYRAVVLNDTSGSSIDGFFSGSGAGAAGEAGVLIVKHSTAAAANRVRGTVEGVATGVSLGPGTESNDIAVTIGNGVRVPTDDHGHGNLVVYNSGGGFIANHTVNAQGGLQDNGNRVAEVLLARQTISRRRNISFDGRLDAAFPRYRLACDDIRTAAGAGGDIVVRVGQQGTVQTGGYAYAMWSTGSRKATGFARSSDSAAAAPLNNSAVPADAGVLGQFDLTIGAPATRDGGKPFKWSASFPAAGGAVETTTGSGVYRGNGEPVTDLDVATSGGDFASITCALYGDN